MFSFFRKKPATPPAPQGTPAGPQPSATAAPTPSGSLTGTALVAPIEVPVAQAVPAERQSWMERLSDGLRKTSTSISQVFTGAQIDDALYEELETALLLADTGVAATEYLLQEVKSKVQASGATHPVQARNILVAALTQLLRPLEKPLVIGEHQPTVIMVAGVNGAGKTTSI